MTAAALLALCGITAGQQPAIAATRAPEEGPSPRPGSVGTPADDPRSSPFIDRSSVDASQRDRVLAAGWKSSPDIAYTTAGDATGFHVLIANARSGYQWRTLTTLSEPGMETDQWIGNACLTGSGKNIVVVYAPRHFTNRPALFARGGFAAVVEVATGKVRKLPEQSSLAYFNPGCGTDDTAVLTQGTGEVGRHTRLLTVDTAKAKRVNAVIVKGEVTSAVPTSSGIVAARGNALVTISK